MQIRAENLPWYKGISIAIFQRRELLNTIVVQELLLTEIKEGEEIPEALVLNQNEAQLLMDDLWHCGIRPSEGTGSAGQLASTQKHLEDMRKLVFDHLIGK